MFVFQFQHKIVSSQQQIKTFVNPVKIIIEMEEHFVNFVILEKLFQVMVLSAYPV